jgi:hypothetical protein
MSSLGRVAIGRFACEAYQDGAELVFDVEPDGQRAAADEGQAGGEEVGHEVVVDGQHILQLAVTQTKPATMTN